MIESWPRRARLKASSILLASCITMSLAKADASYGTETVAIAGIENYLAFSGSGLPNGGKVTELVRAVFAAMGMTIKVGFLPRKRAYAETRNGKFLASFPWFKDDEREKDFLFSDPLEAPGGVVIVPASSPLQFFTRQSGNGKKGCDLLGSRFHSQLFFDENVTVTRVTELSQCLKMIKEKRIDFYFAALSSFSKEELGSEARIIPTDLNLVLKLHLIIDRTNTQGQRIMADFNRALSEIKQNSSQP